MDCQTLAATPEFTAGVVLTAFAVGVVALVFWVWMLIDAIGNDRLDRTEKIVWVLVIVFLHFLGALVYFFAGRGRSRGG